MSSTDHVLIVDLNITEYVNGYEVTTVGFRRKVDTDFGAMADRLFTAIDDKDPHRSPSSEDQQPVGVEAARDASSPVAPTDKEPAPGQSEGTVGTEGDAGNPSAPAPEVWRLG
jgi:hypothetical protein